MIISKVKKVYSYQLQHQFKKQFGVEVIDYKTRQFLDDICDKGIYVRESLSNKAKLRITFLPFLICVAVLNAVSLFKYLFTGSFQFSENSLIVRNMIAWDKYCRFNIIS